MAAAEWPDDDLARGQILAKRYRITDFLGRGGMGLVFAALDLSSGTPVAVKLPRREVRNRKKALARFERESRAATRLRGANTVRVMEVAELDDRTPFIVMELLAGRDLARELEARGPLPVPEAVEIVLQAAAGVAEAHAAGIVHRDLKPHNLFLVEAADSVGSRTVKVLDFGISKLAGGDVPGVTTTNARLGTPLYVSPEQLVSAKYVDARSDIWSLGVILYELLTGTLPFEGPTAIKVAAAIQTVEPPPPSSRRAELPCELDAVVLRALCKDRTKRYQSVAELTRALAPFAPAARIESHPSTAPAVRRSAPAPVTATLPAGATWFDSPHEESAGRGRSASGTPTVADTNAGAPKLLLLAAALIGVLLLLLAFAVR